MTNTMDKDGSTVSEKVRNTGNLSGLNLNKIAFLPWQFGMGQCFHQ
eukprot:CAMPEP_0184351676 /NCGR_PEP_ID=MMETSP1089-20130417/47115_1 /TAXON_ID=38269 ORGANISM="Gloeochaete wittrockiana, Strain SAG46.84" /NCGR_SAMPLE_ID=MMETSP1089 /ASSEMBLY_ACC=CAM_ASM_000445 /LENGTH=45 /DNA_ID= /DNA_START= /DNA_END= /DNA_ORIENTATION=